MLSAPSSTQPGVPRRINPTTGPRGGALRRIGGVDQGVVDNRRASHVGDAVLLDQFEILLYRPCAGKR